jgi:hypothetical protein
VRPLDPRSYRVVPGRHYDTPKELWGFRSDRGTGDPLAIACAFLEANQETLGVDMDTLIVGTPRILYGLGSTHLIFQQRWKRRRINRAYVTVHIGARDQRVFLVKSRAVPLEVRQKAKDARIGEARAVGIAVARVRGRSQAQVVRAPELLWFPARRLIHPAWRIRVDRVRPRASFIVYVSAETGAVMQVYDNLAHATGRARVFLPNPMARDRRFAPLDDRVVQKPTPESYADVTLSGLRGNGRLDGVRATTRLMKDRLRRPDGDFRMDSNREGFEEVSAYYHVDRAVAYVEELGYTGIRRIFHAPLAINARATREDDSQYNPSDRSLWFGTGDVDDAEDGEVVFHEFGHALQDAICPDFGQSQEAAAMGEGFGDYFAASYFEMKKAEPYRLTVMSWDGALMEGTPPSLRRLDSQQTFETFDHTARADEHENGQIWSATLWDVRQVLGRARADRVIVDSHFQLDGFTTFARGARAILDADANLYRGAHLAALKNVFRRRGIGPVE